MAISRLARSASIHIQAITAGATIPIYTIRKTAARIAPYRKLCIRRLWEIWARIP